LLRHTWRRGVHEVSSNQTDGVDEHPILRDLASETSEEGGWKGMPIVLERQEKGEVRL